MVDDPKDSLEQTEDHSPQKDTSSFSAINIAFTFFILTALIFGSFNGTLKAVSDASFSSAKSSVQLAINLIGIMALWLGLVRVLEAGGMMYQLARWLKPVMTRLFPEVPPEHPAMGAMILNISANMLGLGNAATPFGIKAMIELNKLNKHYGTATNAMCLFLTINTSSIALFPLGVIGVRAAAGSSSPAAIWLPTTIATCFSTLVGIAIAKTICGWYPLSSQHNSEGATLTHDEDTAKTDSYTHLRVSTKPWMRVVSILTPVLFVIGIIYKSTSSETTLASISDWLMPGLMMLIVCYGLGRGVKVYEAVTEGAVQGFETAVRIIPFLVAILVAIGMFRASGGMDTFVYVAQPFTSIIGMPAETVPMALVRPLSGSGAFGLMSELINNSPDSYSAFVASVMMGSTETTFYVLAIYFGAIGVTRIRHTLVSALTADSAGIIMAALASYYFYH